MTLSNVFIGRAALTLFLTGFASPGLAQGVIVQAPVPPAPVYSTQPPPLPVCLPIPSGLVGWWPAEGNAEDFAGVNHGVLQGGVTFAPGEVGQAFNFTAPNQAVIFPANPSLDVGNGLGFTLEAWINPTEITQAHPIFEWNTGSSWGVHFHIAPGQPFNTSPGPGELYANILDSSAGWHQLSSPGGVLTTNVFQHVALTYDQASGVATIYCNGLVVGQQIIGSFTPLTTYNLYLGRRPLTAGEDETFAGQIDEAAIYNRALSPDEITAIYTAGSAGKCPTPFPLAIAGQPASQTIAEGGSAVFNVVAVGTGPLHFQWTFAGHNLVDATNSSLSLTNIHFAQGGNYAVKITSPYGVTNSANARLSVLSQNILVYKYSGAESLLSATQNLTFAYSGVMFFQPATTNGYYVGWATIGGKKNCWVNSISSSLLLTITVGPGKSYTLFGSAGSGYDDNGQAHFDLDLLKGWNAILSTGTRQTYVFPETFTGENTQARPDTTGQMKLDQAESTFTFAPAATQNANNAGQTLADLVNAQVASLKAQGYRPQ